MMLRHALGCVAALLAAWAQAQPAALPQDDVVHIVRVVDGDTVWVLWQQQRSKVRLLGIDAPEICQDGGREAQRALRAMLRPQPVRLHAHAYDDYGRWLGSLRLADGSDAAAALVRQGLAWNDRSRRHPGPYAQHEQAARDARRGLFAQARAQYPADFRRSHGSCY